MRLFTRLVVALLWLGAALPAQAAVTITFWSHEFGSSFPHAFLTLRGVPDAGGAPVDSNFGFTARAVTPALLFHPVSGKLDIAQPDYIADSTAQFSMPMTDAQYAAVLALAHAWDAKGPDSSYSLKSHNCVHFVKAAAQVMGLRGLDRPELMKKPRSYLLAVAAANAGIVQRIDQPGATYLTTLPALVPDEGAGHISAGIATATTPPPLPASGFSLPDGPMARAPSR